MGDKMKEEFMECFRTLFKKSADDEKRGVFFSRMLLWYTTCTIIVFLFFGTVMSVSVQKNYKGQIDRLNEGNCPVCQRLYHYAEESV